MNLPFSLVEPFFHFLSILILIYLCFISLVKYIRKSEYSLFVFRVTIFSVIFYGIDLILNAIKNETLSTALAIGLVASILGLITHNEQLRKERKFFRIFIFFSIALICSLFSTT